MQEVDKHTDMHYCDRMLQVCVITVCSGHAVVLRWLSVDGCQLMAAEATWVLQGIVNPLMVQKTDKRGGTIVASPAAQAAAVVAAAAEAMPPPKKAKVNSLPHHPECFCSVLVKCKLASIWLTNVTLQCASDTCCTWSCCPIICSATSKAVLVSAIQQSMLSMQCCC